MPGFMPQDPDLIRVAVLEEIRRLGDDAPTQAEMHRRTGVPKANISNWLAGKKTVTTETASRLMEVLGLEIRRMAKPDLAAMTQAERAAYFRAVREG